MKTNANSGASVQWSGRQIIETQMEEWMIEINKAIVLEGYLTVRNKN